MTCINHGVMPIGVWRSTGRGFLAVMTLLCCVTVAAQQSCDGWVTSTTSSIPTGHSFSFTIYSPTPTVPGSITSSGDFTVRLNGVPVQSGNFNPQSTFTTVPVSGGLTQSMGPGTYSLTAHWTYQWSFIFTNGSCTGDESRSVQVTPVAPTASCHDLTVWLNANGEAVIPIAAVGAGSRYGNNTPADPGSFTLDVPTVDCGDVGPPITVTLTVTDPSTGLSDTCNAVIEVRDSYAPTRAYCPSPDPVSVDPGGCTGVINYSPPTWDDHCDGMGLTGTLGAGPAPGDSRPVGTYNVSWYFMDSSGLSGPACHFTVVVEDHEPPTLDPCPTNIEVRATLPSCAQVVTWTPPSITDNCPGAVLSSTHQPGDHFFDGTTTVVYTATDVGGNVVSCSFDVTVMADFEPPARYDVLPPAMLGQASGPRQLVLADMGRQAFDHALDGHLDLVVLNRDRAELSVLYNDGTGHFGDIELVALALGGFAPTGLATGDFDGVGGLDLVVSLRDAAAVEVVFHDGTGFVPGPQISLTGSRPAGIVVGDLDGDGRSDDLAVALRGFAPGVGDGVSLVFDVAPGFMGTAQALPKTSGLPFRSPENLALCERRVGSDTVMDLVVTDQADTTGYQNVLLFENDGLGGFSEAALHLEVPMRPFDVCCGDFDADGLFNDIAVSSRDDPSGSAGALQVFVNVEGPSFDASSFVAGSSRATGPAGYLACGDLRRDSIKPSLVARDDVVVTMTTQDQFVQFLSFDGPSQDFLGEQVCPAGGEPMGVRTGDLNGDGLPDLVLVNRGAGQVQAHLSRAVAFAQEFGSGCSGSAGTPEAGHTALAILGQRATIVLRAARPLSACVLGISTGVVHDVIASTSNGDVTIYLAGPVLAFSLVTDGQGGRKFSFDVPITPQLGGEDLYFQWLVFDPQGAFQQTVATSSALGMRIGY